MKRSKVLYPISACYIAGVAALIAYAANWVPILGAVVGFGFICTLIFLAVTYRQLSVVHNDINIVHDLVNSQRTAMAERIDALTAALKEAHVPLPPDPEPEKVNKALAESR